MKARLGLHKSGCAVPPSVIVRTTYGRGRAVRLCWPLGPNLSTRLYCNDCHSVKTRMSRQVGVTGLMVTKEFTTGRLVSTSTVRGRLHEGDLYARLPAICVPLTSRHGRERLRWTHQHVHCKSDQWRAGFFTDESRLSLQSDSRCSLIWREPVTHYHPSNIRKRDAYRGGSVCVWGSISLGGHTDVYVFPRGT
ncbi:hypothetical protein AVEN_146683-1 [Araneus ventricosus]|uniref:Transposase Tc1-like domain-containing protein n=1 Tax=Araneus ventricosus TaxID=182803 RepID=A0A4Y2LCJ3_ARAVE|nr:hypothetical protein AVEN_146683-1 [Araneus ventricosus]